MTGDGSWTVEPPRRRRRTLLFVVAAVAVVGGLGAVSAVALTSNDKVGFPVGSGTATITWHSTSSSDTSNHFSGTVAGIPVAGDAVATPPPFGGPSNTSPGLPSTLPLARWTGTFEGKPFDLDVALSNLQSADPFSGVGVRVEVTGRYGGQPVHMTSAFSAADARSDSLRFTGTVGPYRVTGTVQPTGGGSAHPASNTARATFVVTG
jgi:hypothetical protein